MDESGEWIADKNLLLGIEDYRERVRVASMERSATTSEHLVKIPRIPAREDQGCFEAKPTEPKSATIVRQLRMLGSHRGDDCTLPVGRRQLARGRLKAARREGNLGAVGQPRSAFLGDLFVYKARYRSSSSLWLVVDVGPGLLFSVSRPF